MRLKVIVILCAVVAIGASTDAVEWKGRLGAGLNGGLSSLLLPGSDFRLFNQDHQTFGMALIGGGELRYGLTRRLVLGLSYRFEQTYDDSTATSSQSFTWQSEDNALVRLHGHLLDVTARYYFRPEKNFQPFVVGGLGIDHWRLKLLVGRVRDWYPPVDWWYVDGVVMRGTYSVTDWVARAGGGLTHWIGEKVTVDFQATLTFGLVNLDTELPEALYGPDDWSGWSQRPFRARLEAAIGVAYYIWGGRDSDKDGVKDKKDQCPDTPKGAKVDSDGCPLDGDGDGVYDGLDQCPDTPPGVLVDALGCPKDSDNDGVFDGLDQCPDTPEGVAVDARGCPLDSDGDGVPDYLDKEPNTPKGARVDANGVAIDSDKDGVPDGIDKCPDTPANTDVDRFGCPFDADFDGVPDSVDKCLGTPPGVEVDESGCPTVERITTKITLSDEVKYALNSYELTDRAGEILDGVAASMRAYPETRIKISGFCDSTGPEEHNLQLSENRARAVYDYLVTKQVSPDRMVVKGYGEDPQYFIADNSTREGRQKNRRVEIESISD